MTFAPTLLPRDVLKAEGPDTRTLLNGLLTIPTMAPPPLSYGALLTPQGKVMETLFLWRTAEGFLIDVPAGRGEALLKRLMLYRLRADVALEDITDSYQCGAVPDADAVPDGVPLAEADPRAPDLGHRVLGSRDRMAGLAEAPDAYHRHLIGAGVPDLGAGFDTGAAFPLDVNLDALHAIDHKKGCFVGQEVASRMYRKGEVRKRTYTVTGQPLAGGMTVKAGDSTLGEVTVAAGDHGLALIRVDRLSAADGAAITADGTTVTLRPPAYLS